MRKTLKVIGKTIIPAIRRRAGAMALMMGGTILMSIHQVYSVTAIENLTNATDGIHGIVMGKGGASAVAVGTLIGLGGAMAAGKWMIALAILVIGMLLTFQFDMIRTLFTAH